MSVNPRRVRILNKLESYGADTEKKITALTYPEIMKICRDSKTLAFQDMEAIVKLQEEIKARRIIPFLLGSEVSIWNQRVNRIRKRRKQMLKTVTRKKTQWQDDSYTVEVESLKELKEYIESMAEGTIARIEIRMELKNND